MTVADRIKQRRTELGLSQEELAKRMGYSSKSAVSRTENAGDNIGQKRIVAFAKALNVKPSYLMGWTDEVPQYIEDVISHLEDHESLADAGRKDFMILQKINALNETNYNVIIKMIDALLESQQK